MSRKRRNTSSPEPDSPPPKRHHAARIQPDWDSPSDDERAEKPQLDEFTGQIGAFPGLGNDGDQLFYGPALDGIDYLRMVRSEAKGVPHILSAPTSKYVAERARPVEEDGCKEEAGGYYYDGAYAAVGGVLQRPEDDLPVAQEYCYEALLKDFRVVQATMRCTPPLAMLERLHPSQLISFPEESRKARQQWEQLITSTDPHPAQIAVIDPQSVLQLVILLRRRLPLFLRARDEKIISRVGAWLWATLARCRDRDELSSEEIGEIRQLAQRAVQMRAQTIKSLEGLASDLDEEGGSQGTEGYDEVRPVVEAKLPKTGRDNGEEMLPEGQAAIRTDRETLLAITLDMVITVVGEVYGQRDLLESRVRWTVDEMEMKEG